LISGAPNYDINGKVTGSIGIHLDITEQKEEKCIYLISEKNINAVVISDVEGRIEWVNASFEKCQAIPRGVNRVKPAVCYKAPTQIRKPLRT
jgi:PAS domain-containing protein